jgi:two-component system, cell cycle sensor histidine kinase and response regulator CckA
MEDFTECRRAETVLPAEELFQSVANALPMMISWGGPDGRAGFFNKSWLSFRGRSVDQERGFSWTEGVHPEDRHRVLTAIASSLETRKEYYVEYRLRRADGEYRSVLCSGVSRFSPDGTFVGYIATCTDISDYKRTPEEAASRQKPKSIDLLAKGISHNFNSMLAAILASAGNALAAHADGLPIEEEFQKIRLASIRGAELVQTLEIYGGDETTILEPLDLASLIDEILPLFHPFASNHDRLEVTLGNDLPIIRGNRGRLRHVILNLLMNAYEAIGDGDGKVCLNASFVRVPENASADGAEVTPGDYVRLEVSDTGIGMEPEVHAQILDPFFTKLEGRGLGLAAVEKILRQHGAVMRVVRTPGRGTTFQAWFPAAEKLENNTTSMATGEKPLGSGTILVVEDEELLRVALVKGLKRRGFSVVEARDAAGALTLIRSDPSSIDSILLDTVLPGKISSRAVFEEAQRIKPSVKIILTSAYREETAMAAFSGMSVECFLRKPFHFADIVELLENGPAGR